MVDCIIPEFRKFSSIPRYNRQIVITEKIDGTNACVYISDDCLSVMAGSRNRWITPEADNYGFARWVEENKNTLLELGPGYHYGEWWGKGIQRGYGENEKIFSLFNVGKWNDYNVPSCCRVVPTISMCDHTSQNIQDALYVLETEGSLASPGFYEPEGIVIFHTHAGQYFKITLQGDEYHKSQLAK